MTTTKIIYLAAVVLPFGFVVLAAVLIMRQRQSRRCQPLVESVPYST